MERELLLEIGCEELPASWLPALTAQLGDVIAAALGERRLAPEGPVETYSTPRRLTARIARLAERQTDLEDLVDRAAGVGCIYRKRCPGACGDRFCSQAGRRRGGSRTDRDTERAVPGVPAQAARKGRC